MPIAKPQIGSRISKDLPIGMDAMFFRQVEKSTETNLLDDLSKSLEQGANLLADDDNLKNLLLMNDNDNPLNDEDDDMLLTSGTQENGVFSLLEDPIGDLSSNNPIMITPRNDGQQIINLQAQAEISDKNYFTPNARNDKESEEADLIMGGT